MLGESQPPSKALEPRIVVTRNGRKGRHRGALAVVASVISPHEDLNRGARGEPDGAAERRPRGEGHLQPTGSRCRSQCAFVYAELTRELIERQACGVPRVVRQRQGGALKPSWYGDCLPSRDFPMLIDLFLQGRLELDRFVSERIGIDGVEDAFARMQRGEVLRSVVMF